MQESLWFKGLQSELDNNSAITIYCDSRSAIELSKNAMYHARTKHIDIRHHFIRDVQESGEIKIEHVSTEGMVTDILTKGLGKVKHEVFVKALNLCSSCGSVAEFAE